jgi:ssDNA-binding Zn-finger/Zn-ribbon topoisomerase 1
MITIDKRCDCKDCIERTTDIYRMVGHCQNCGQRDILMLFRSGDKAGNGDCPVCGNWRSVSADRLATPDEIPES